MRDTARILGPGASPAAALGSCRCWGRLADRVHDPGSARARHSDVVSLPATIQLTAPLVLSDEGHQGIEHVRHGAGRLPQPAGDGWAPERNPEGSSSSRETSSESSSGTVWRPDKSPARRHPQHLKSVLVSDGDDPGTARSEHLERECAEPAALLS
jgi:hypothetical protein